MYLGAPSLAAATMPKKKKMLPKTALEKQKLASLCCSHAAVAAGDDDVAWNTLAITDQNVKTLRTNG